MNDPDIFPELNFDNSEKMADKLLKKFPIIERIELFGEMELFEGECDDQRYVLLITRPGNVDPLKVAELETFVDGPAFKIDGLIGSMYSKPISYPPLSDWEWHIINSSIPLSEDPISGAVEGKRSWLLYPITQTKECTDSTSNQDLGSIIKEIQISYQNENEIKVSFPGKRIQTHTWDKIGFKKQNSPAWKKFIQTLQDRPHHFETGKPNSGGYSKHRKQLLNINEYLKNFLENEYGLMLPGRYKLYDRLKGEKSGTYLFKFEIITDDFFDRNKYERYSKSRLEETLKDMVVEYRSTPEYWIEKKVESIKNTLMEKHGLNEKQIREIIDPKTDEKVIKESFSHHKFMPHENVEDSGIGE